MRQINSTTIFVTQYGRMMVNRYDINQTGALGRTARSPDHDDIVLLSRLIKPDGVFIDVGANFGCYTLGMAPFCREVHAFEAQRHLAYLLCGSVMLNGYENVIVHNAAVGDHIGELDLPIYNYEAPMNFGSVEFGGEQKETLTQQRQTGCEKVRLTTIDEYDLVPDIIKIDVEGMESGVLAGATNTIEKYRPIVLLEWFKSDKKILSDFFLNRNYEVTERGNDLLCVPSVNS